MKKFWIYQIISLLFEGWLGQPLRPYLGKVDGEAAASADRQWHRERP